MVLEDLHWADEATLDVLRLLGRRVDSVPALVLASFRDDELDRVDSFGLSWVSWSGVRSVEAGASRWRRLGSWPARMQLMGMSCIARRAAIRSS